MSEELESGLEKGWEDIDWVLHHQGLPYVPKIIRTELISRHHDDLLAGHFGIEKTRELVVWKYYWETLWHDVETYVKRCDVCLALKAVRHKPLGGLTIAAGTYASLEGRFCHGVAHFHQLERRQLWLDPSHHWPAHENGTLSASQGHNWCSWPHRSHLRCGSGLPDSIVSDWGSIFTLKFWSSLCYFLGIKRRFSTAFHSQTDGQTKRQSCIMKAYLRAFVNYEQNDWARLLPMAEFSYNNAKNASTGHPPFEVNCGYHRYLYVRVLPDSRSIFTRNLDCQINRSGKNLQEMSGFKNGSDRSLLNMWMFCIEDGSSLPVTSNVRAV